jgi:peptidoglycan/LPS O-acetylase OafA/YrhL
VPPVGPPATNVAFALTFGVFIVAFAALSVYVVAWTIRRDRRGRAAWMERRRSAESGDPPDRNGTRPESDTP